jgi:hypothetical protein
MPLVFLPLNFIFGVMLIVRIFQYLNQYRKLAKKIAEYDCEFYLERYCDRTLKSPMNSSALVNEIMHPGDIPPNIKNHCDDDFKSIRQSFFSVTRWFVAVILLGLGQQFLH